MTTLESGTKNIKANHMIVKVKIIIKENKLTVKIIRKMDIGEAMTKEL